MAQQPLTDDADRIASARNLEQMLERDRRLAVSGFMSTASGRMAVMRWLLDTGCFAPAWSPDGTEAFRKGQEMVGHAICADLRVVCPDEYDLMVREHETRERQA